MSDVRLWTLVVLLCLVIAGCNHDKRASSIPAGASKDVLKSELLETEIKAGWGIERCHIGMSIDECIKSLGDPKVQMLDGDTIADGTMSWYDLGIMVAFKDEAVVQVYFEYLSEEYSAFPGRLSSNSTTSNPMSAVVTKYGSPEEMQKSRISNWQPNDTPELEKEFFEKHFAGRMETWYDYQKQGVDVCFVDNEISYVRVYPPQE